MNAVDPATGQALPPDAIQRVLFIANGVHVYNIPPMVPGKGHVAATWTADDNKRQIFTARLRVIETAVTLPESSGGEQEKVKTDICLEDASSGQLFAAAPYTAAAVVEPVSDSSRFFALRVQDEQGRKASLGIGFEERSEAFDLGVALQEAQKTLPWAQGTAVGQRPLTGERSSSKEGAAADDKRDYSLKEGQTITVNLPGRSSGRKRPDAAASDAPLSSFSLPPPPSASAVRSSGLSSPPSSSSSGAFPGILPPPPPPASASTTTSSSNRTTQPPPPPSASQAAELGFDDGKFGEFA